MSKCVIGPNFATVGHSMIEISRFSNFNIAAVRHLGFLNSQNFNGRQSYEGEQLNMRHHTQNFVTVARYGDFSVFQDGGRRYLGFSKSGNFRGGKGQERSQHMAMFALRYGVGTRGSADSIENGAKFTQSLRTRITSAAGMSS